MKNKKRPEIHGKQKAADKYALPDGLEMQRIIPLQAAAKICGLSPDSLKRNHAGKIIRLGPRRLGIRVADALTINFVSHNK